MKKKIGDLTLLSTLVCINGKNSNRDTNLCLFYKEEMYESHV